MANEHSLEPILEKVLKKTLDEQLKPIRAEQAESRKELNRAVGLIGRLSEDQFRLETRLLTAFRNFENSIQLIVDPLLKKLDSEREESIIHQEQHDRFEEVEQRVEKLEGVRSQGRHTL